jgi:hypothetical protein
VVEIPLEFVSEPQTIHGVGVIWVEADSLIVIPDGVVVIPLPIIGVASIIECDRKITG